MLTGVVVGRKRSSSSTSIAWESMEPTQPPESLKLEKAIRPEVSSRSYIYGSNYRKQQYCSFFVFALSTDTRGYKTIRTRDHRSSERGRESLMTSMTIFIEYIRWIRYRRSIEMAQRVEDNVISVPRVYQHKCWRRWFVHHSPVSRC
jgi:hypothetical protein